MADKMVELLKIGPMLSAAGGALVLAGILLTVFEAMRPRGRAGLVLAAMGAVLLIVAALTTQQTGVTAG
jgi:hypothetical protein